MKRLRDFAGTCFALLLAFAFYLIGWADDFISPFEEWFDRFGMIPAMTAAGVTFLLCWLGPAFILAAALNRVSIRVGLSVTLAGALLLIIVLSLPPFRHLRVDAFMVIAAFSVLGAIYWTVAVLTRLAFRRWQHHSSAGS